MIDVRKSPELQAALLALRGLPRELRLQINKDVRAIVNPLWRDALAQREVSKLDRAIYKGARVTVGSDRITLMAATSTKALSGGLVPSQQWQGDEFGMIIKPVRYERQGHQVVRRIGKQFPPRRHNGRIGFDAASEVGTRVVRVWVETIVDMFRGIANITPR